MLQCMRMSLVAELSDKWCSRQLLLVITEFWCLCLLYVKLFGNQTKGNTNPNSTLFKLIASSVHCTIFGCLRHRKLPVQAQLWGTLVQRFVQSLRLDTQGFLALKVEAFKEIHFKYFYAFCLHSDTNPTGKGSKYIATVLLKQIKFRMKIKNVMNIKIISKCVFNSRNSIPIVNSLIQLKFLGTTVHSQF